MEEPCLLLHFPTLILSVKGVESSRRTQWRKNGLVQQAGGLECQMERTPRVPRQGQILIREVMEIVELTTLKDAIIGLPGFFGLSTGQRKRLTIAVELIANPSIIFMDEPTTGLDARSAAIVMRTVRSTVDIGRTVVCTIHQPTIDIFESFDESITGAKLKEGRTKGLVHQLSEPNLGSEDLHFSTRCPQHFLEQLALCLWKQHRSYWCNPQYSATRILFTILIALLLGTVYWKSGSKIWYFWANPVAWSLYGLLTSQYGDRDGMLDTVESIRAFLLRYFGFEMDFLKHAAMAVLGFNLLFALIFIVSIKVLNFQNR
uniref:ABC transporter domain-containing protein n=1 Tax=Oryza punctata TaxID=4537 RepID=A0A0E0JL05_ORYPU